VSRLPPADPTYSRRDADAAGILQALADLESLLHNFVLWHEDAAEEPELDALFGTSLPMSCDLAARCWAGETLDQPYQAEDPLTNAPIQSIERLRLAIDDTSMTLRAACPFAQSATASTASSPLAF
jgi:hypothetical protein